MKALLLLILLTLVACGPSNGSYAPQAQWIEVSKSCAPNLSVDSSVKACLDFTQNKSTYDSLKIMLEDCLTDTFFITYGQIGYEALLNYETELPDVSNFTFTYEDSGNACTIEYQR